MPKQMDIRHKPILPPKPTHRRRLTFTPRYIPLPKKVTEKEVEPPRWLTRLLTTLAYGIPLAFLAYVLYINYLPFGYDKNFTIVVGSPTDTTPSEFYLEPSKDLSERKTAPDGTTYRELNGMAYAVFKPNVVLKDATITVSVEGEGVSIIPPHIEFDPDTIDWDYSWDFTKGIPLVTTQTTQATTSTSAVTSSTSTTLSKKAVTPQAFDPKSPPLIGNAFILDNEVPFNGRDTRLELASSSDLFEADPFSLYVEWTPRNSIDDTQQIIGHFNWELWQNKNNVEFRVGRMNKKDGPSYSIKYNVTQDFFNTRHSALAVYSPSTHGYIELFIDGNFAGRTNIGTDRIWEDNGIQNLSIGWTPHNYQKSPHFLGNIDQISIANMDVVPILQQSSFDIINSEPQIIPIITPISKTLNLIHLNVVEK